MKAVYNIINSDGAQDTVTESARIHDGQLQVQGKYGWTPATGSLEPDQLVISQKEFGPVAECIAQMAMLGSIKKLKAY